MAKGKVKGKVKGKQMGRNRPLTQREIQDKKRQTEGSRATITVLNTSRQIIPIHVKPAPGIDFYQGAQDIRLNPGQKMTFPKKRLWSTQIDRLQKRKFLQVFADTEKSNDLKKKLEAKKARADQKAIKEAEEKKKKVSKKKKSTKKKTSSYKSEPKKDNNISSKEEDNDIKQSTSDE